MASTAIRSPGSPSPGLVVAADRTPAEPLAGARQLVLVTAKDWSSTTATLRRFERGDESASWSAVGAPFAVSLGRGGLGWGRGVHRVAADGAPLKREGDGRSPAGVFRLTEAFGYAPGDSALARSAKLRYWPISSDLICVDDGASSHYNRFVERSRESVVDWTSHEEMLRGDGQYAFGVVVAHNTAPALAGAGSCIFLHVWRGPGLSTAGCTAAAADDLRVLIGWLDERQQPLLVQLPEPELERRRSAWRLP